MGSKPGEQITHAQQHHDRAETAITDVHTFSDTDEKFQKTRSEHPWPHDSQSFRRSGISCPDKLEA